MIKHYLSRFLSIKNKLNAAFLVLFGRSYFYPANQYSYHNLSFSQEGEDAILMRLFQERDYGFYVDIGAHHPQRFSNTYRFYLRGWRGINIDPRPGCKELFDKIRPNDINLQLGVALTDSSMQYYQFHEPALNTFDKELMIEYIKSYPLVQTTFLPVKPLKSILSEYMLPGQDIDFMSIDVEGLDEEVLRSNDWSQFRPKYVLVEALNLPDMIHVVSISIYQYMTEVEYCLYAKSVNTLIFKDSRKLPSLKPPSIGDL
jgi:FkbM family methyltransferase